MHAYGAWAWCMGIGICIGVSTGMCMGTSARASASASAWAQPPPPPLPSSPLLSPCVEQVLESHPFSGINRKVQIKPLSWARVDAKSWAQAHLMGGGGGSGSGTDTSSSGKCWDEVLPPKPRPKPCPKPRPKPHPKPKPWEPKRKPSRPSATGWDEVPRLVPSVRAPLPRPPRPQPPPEAHRLPICRRRAAVLICVRSRAPAGSDGGAIHPKVGRRAHVARRGAVSAARHTIPQLALPRRARHAPHDTACTPHDTPCTPHAPPMTPRAPPMHPMHLMTPHAPHALPRRA